MCDTHAASVQKSKTKHKQIKEACDRNFRYGSLEDDQILRWVSNIDWRPPGNPKDRHELLGKIRVIFCERSLYEPLDFPISRLFFEEVEQAFHLHPATLPTFKSHAGTFSRYLTFCDANPTKLKRIGKPLFHYMIVAYDWILNSIHPQSSPETRDCELRPISII